MHNKFARSYLLTGLLIGGFILAHAQNVPTLNAPPPLPPYGPGVAVVRQGSAAGMGFQFVSGEPAISAQATQAVAGAPYSLDATIESAQTLADGNRIVHQQNVHLYRDSKGRTRREETLAAIGPWAASGNPPTMITIQDPVSGVSYFLDPQRKIATKIPAPPTGKGVMVTGGMISDDAGDGPVTVSVMGSAPIAGGFVSGSEGEHVAVLGFNGGPPAQVVHPEEKSESLGKETIVGLAADGTRTTTTIPANVIGNERPLAIILERWYSADLQIVLRSRQTDPRFGETIYEVTNLDRREPSPSLFEAPSDYTVREAHALLSPGAAPK